MEEVTDLSQDRLRNKSIFLNTLYNNNYLSVPLDRTFHCNTRTPSEVSPNCWRSLLKDRFTRAGMFSSCWWQCCSSSSLLMRAGSSKSASCVSSFRIFGAEVKLPILKHDHNRLQPRFFARILDNSSSHIYIQGVEVRISGRPVFGTIAISPSTRKAMHQKRKPRVAKHTAQLYSHKFRSGSRSRIAAISMATFGIVTMFIWHLCNLTNNVLKLVLWIMNHSVYTGTVCGFFSL